MVNLYFSLVYSGLYGFGMTLILLYMWGMWDICLIYVDMYVMLWEIRYIFVLFSLLVSLFGIGGGIVPYRPNLI